MSKETTSVHKWESGLVKNPLLRPRSQFPAKKNIEVGIHAPPFPDITSPQSLAQSQFRSWPLQLKGTFEM